MCDADGPVKATDLFPDEFKNFDSSDIKQETGHGEDDSSLCTGLGNAGNSCYINALMQALFPSFCTRVCDNPKQQILTLFYQRMLSSHESIAKDNGRLKDLRSIIFNYTGSQSCASENLDNCFLEGTQGNEDISIKKYFQFIVVKRYNPVRHGETVQWFHPYNDDKHAYGESIPDIWQFSIA